MGVPACCPARLPARGERGGERCGRRVEARPTLAWVRQYRTPGPRGPHIGWRPRSVVRNEGSTKKLKETTFSSVTNCDKKRVDAGSAWMYYRGIRREP